MRNGYATYISQAFKGCLSFCKDIIKFFVDFATHIATS